MATVQQQAVDHMGTRMGPGMMQMQGQQLPTRCMRRCLHAAANSRLGRTLPEALSPGVWFFCSFSPSVKSFYRCTQ